MKNHYIYLGCGLLFSCASHANFLNAPMPLAWQSTPIRAVFSPTNELSKGYDVALGRRFVSNHWLEMPIDTPYAQFNRWQVHGGLAYTQIDEGSDTYGLLPLMSTQAKNAYAYHSNVLARQVFAQTKWQYPFSRTLSPYFLIGLGGSFSTMPYSAGSNASLLASVRDYASHTTHGFAYRVGLGADLNLATKLRLGLAYHFSDLSGIGFASTRVNSMSMLGLSSPSSFASNELSAQLKYII